MLCTTKCAIFFTKPIVLCLLLTTAIAEHQWLNQTKGTMFPDLKKQIIEVDSILTLTCSFTEKSFNISWKLPDYLSNHPELSMAGNRLSFKWDRNETHSSSTMTLLRVRPRDSGLYGCYLTTLKWLYVKAFEIQQYVYVFSTKDLVIIDGVDDDDFNSSSNSFRYFFKHGAVGIVPCKPTHPNVTITLNRKHFFIADNLDYRPVVLSQNWLVEPERGLTLKNATLSDVGEYECVGTMNDLSNRKYFKIVVSGLELTRIQGPDDDPVEGSSVTLVCRTFMLSSPPEWAYLNRYTQTLYNMDEANPPEGIQIVTTKFDVFGDDLSFYESRLQLNNVTSDSKTTFHCKTNNDEELISQALSFKVKNSPEIRKRLESSFIQLRKRRPNNITCTGSPSDKTIQWFKDGKEYSGLIGSINNSSILQFKGLSNESGNYTCSTQGEKYKQFEVVYFDEKELSITETIAIAVTVTLLIIVIPAVIIAIKLYFKKKRKEIFPGAHELLKGNPKEINSHLCMEEQVESIPYDKRWEFPRNRLKLGIQLGTGCFGRVVKAEAIGIKGSCETVKTVAVKMVRSKANVAALEALVSELKILIYLGSHLNVVNLLGACTKNITKGELLIVVEYCRFGNLQTYLINHRNNFINLVDEIGNMKLNNESIPINKRFRDGYILCDEKEGESLNKPESHTKLVNQPENTDSNMIIYANEERAQELEFYLQYQQNPEMTPNQTISTRDLICWSFQVARGMDYLTNKKVLHGDLAARNILLADDGVVKVSDFGMSRQLYCESNYQKKGQGLMPIKWMAIESLTDRIFSSQSDVWSFGVLLWEIFSLGKIPYPGMDADSQLVKKLENGYRMEMPAFAPNPVREMMNNCWKMAPNDRPTFNQLQEIIGKHLESSVSSYYLDLNASYDRFG